MANAQLRTGDNTGSRESATEALRYLNPAKDSVYISGAHSAIAISYRTQGFPEDAVPEYQNALNYSTSRQHRIANLNNMAIAYREQEKYGEAINILQNLVEESASSEPHLGARYLDNLAYTKWLRDPEASVENDLLVAMELREETEDLDGLLASYTHLTDYYFDKNKALATNYAGKLLETARNYGNSETQLKALKYLLQLSPGQTANTYSLEYVKISDSLSDAALKAKNTFAKIRFDEERKQQEILNLATRNTQQALETQRLRTQSYSVILIFLLFILGLSF